MAGFSLGTAVGFLTLDATGFAAGIDAAAASMAGLNTKVATVSGALTTIGGTFTRVGTLATVGMTLPVAAAGVASIKTASDFEYAMSRVAAVTSLEGGKTGDEFKKISDRAMELAQKTRYTQTEVSDAMYYMGLAGWNATQIFDGVPGVLALAAASGEDLSRVSDIVTDSLTAFGKEAKDTNEFVNVLAATMASSNTNVDQLGEAFKYVAPVAGSFGYTIQDVALALGTAANNGIKASQGGTSLRMAFNKLMNPTEQGAALMEKFGVSLFDSEGKAYSLRSVMDNLRSTFGDLQIDIHDANGEVMEGEQILEKYGKILPTSQMEKLTAITQMFGVRALPTMLSIIDASDDKWKDLSEAIDGAQESFDGAGHAFGMADEMMNTLQGDWWIFTSTLSVTAAKIGELANGPLRDLLQRFTEMLQKFNELDPAEQKFIIKKALMLAAIGPVLMIFGKLLTGTVSMINTFKVLGDAFSTLGGGIVKIGGKFSTLLANIKGVNTGVTTVAKTMSSTTGTALVPFGSAMGGVASNAGLVETEMLNVVTTSGLLYAQIAAIIAIIAILVAAFITLWKTNEEFRDTIIGIWESIKEKFVEAGQRITESINALGFDFENIVEVLKTIWFGFCDLIAPYFVGVFTYIESVISGFLNIFSGWIQFLTGIVVGFRDGDWSQAWEGIKNVFKGNIELMLAPIKAIGTAVKGMIDAVLGWFGTDWETIWTNAKDAVSNWWKSVVNWVGSIPDKVSKFVSNVKSSISTFLSNVWESIVTFFTGIIEWFVSIPSKVQEVIDTIIQGVTTFVSNVIMFIQQLPTNIMYNLGYIIGYVAGWVVQMVQKALEFGINFVQNIITFIQELPGKIEYFLLVAFFKVGQWVTDMVNKAIELGTTFVSNVISFFQELPGKIAEFTVMIYTTVLEWTANMIDKAMELGKKFLENIVSFFQELPGKINSFITSAWNYVKDWAASMVAKALSMAKDFYNNIVNTIKELPGKIKEFFDDIIKKMITFAEDFIKKAKEAAEDVYDKIVTKIGEIPGQVEEIGKNIVSGIWNGITSMGDWLRQQITGFANGIIDGFKKGLEVNSPSKRAAREVGSPITEGIGYGFIRALPSTMKDMQSALSSGFEGLSIPTIEIKDIAVSLSDSLSRVCDEIKGQFMELTDIVNDSVNSMIEKIDVLADAVDMALSDGIVSDNILSSVSTSGNIQSVQEAGVTSGDTFIFMTDEPIDEIQAAKLLRQTQRDLIEGF